MHESYNTALSLWPAATLPASVTRELRSVGVDLAAHKVNDGQFSARRTAAGTVLLDLSFDGLQDGLTALEAVLATLRLARISYVAWDAKQGEIAGTGRAFDPDSAIEREFSVMADGEPVLTASDLSEFEGNHSDARELIDAIHAWLRLPIPNDLSDIADDELTIVTVSDCEEEDDDPVEMVGAVAGSPGAYPLLTNEFEEGR